MQIGQMCLPIETDDEQIEDRRVRRQVIQREPSIADIGSQLPPTGQNVDGEQGHGDEPDGKVSDGQAEQEVIGDGLQLLVDLERDHHHAVASDGQQAEEAGHDGDQHHFSVRIRQLEIILRLAGCRVIPANATDAGHVVQRHGHAHIGARHDAHSRSTRPKLSSFRFFFLFSFLTVTFYYPLTRRNFLVQAGSLSLSLFAVP